MKDRYIMQSTDSQFSEKERERRKIKRIYGGVVLPMIPGYYMWTDPTYAYGGGYMSVATNTGGGADSGAGEGTGGDGGGAAGQ